MLWFVLFVGVGSIANALWMLAGPMHWYTDLPAAIPDTGPFNPHFVRDIGGGFLAAGPGIAVPLIAYRIYREDRASNS